MQSGDGSGGEFAPTRWSLVRRAADTDQQRAREALEELCRAYWFPLYAFARRRGLDAATAEDVVQAFLGRLIEKRELARVAPEKGRLRSFLLAAMQNFVSNWRASEESIGRGGGSRRVDFDRAEADERLALVARSDDSPERAFERAFARELMQRCIASLEEEYASSGRRPIFEALACTLQAGEDPPRLAQLADELGTTAGALKVAAHRLRARFGERLRELIAETVAGPDEVEEELRALFRAAGA